MISRFYLKELLSFVEAELNFKNGLVVFSGPSGSGKSILMESFLALFGYKEALATLSEATIDKALKASDEFDIELNDEITVKEIKKEKTRYFLNAQNISKNNLTKYIEGNIRYLHLQDKSDFKSSSLLNYLDKISLKNDKDFEILLDDYRASFKEYKDISARLEKIREEELKVEELKEFAKFEIEKIDEINPKIGEYEELSQIKKQISKKDKIEEKIKEASGIFAYTSSVNEVLNLLEKESTAFDDMINELTNIFETFSDKMYELEDLNIEDILDRIEKLSSLQKKFGGIEQALEYRDKKQEELKHYENISFEKSELEKNLEKLSQKVTKLSSLLTISRKNSAVSFSKMINSYLQNLYLDSATLELLPKELDAKGADLVTLKIKNIDLNQISSGELNRVRLSLLAAISDFALEENGVLFLDEIDANVSGKESSAIANLLLSLSKNYQIFAISHQPQLSANANQHFFVEKVDGNSIVRELNKDERINEIARMISGEDIADEAIEFARKLLI